MKAAFLTNLLVIGTTGLLAVCPLDSASRADEQPASGKIYLVGMGPGDPDLATVRAVRVLKSADRVFCFSYLTDTVTPLAKPGAVEEVTMFLAKRFYGSNRRHLPEQMLTKAVNAAKKFEQFAAKVRQLVADGKTVAIADGGDPLIFGAWAWVTEEFDDLPLEVVPGVSSFNAANAALKRDVMWGGRRCVVLTGGDILGCPTEGGRMTTPSVFFTHRAPVRQLVPRLLDQYPADTPVAVICNAGCQDKEEIIRATLGTLPDRLGERQLSHLNILYVGDILTLKHKE